MRKITQKLTGYLILIILTIIIVSLSFWPKQLGDLLGHCAENPLEICYQAPVRLGLPFVFYQNPGIANQQSLGKDQFSPIKLFANIAVWTILSVGIVKTIRQKSKPWNK